MSRPRRTLLDQLDWPLIGTTVALLAMGLLAVYSATQVPSSPARQHLWMSQIQWMVAGLVFLVIATALPYRVCEEYGHILYAGTIFLLLLVPVIGVEKYGAKRWLDLGGFNFQPSEPAKVFTVFMVARYLARRRVDLSNVQELGVAAAIAGVPFLLIMKQPDLGTSLSIPASTAAMLFWAGMPVPLMLLFLTPLISVISSFVLWLWLPYIALLALGLRLFRARRLVMIGALAVNILFGLATPTLWNHLKPYQRERVATFLDPNRDRSGSGYQIIQSRIAVGSGGAVGKGYLQGTQKALSFLPMQHTDFIFSVVGEEAGFAGSVALVALLTLLVGRGYYIAGRARNRFASLMVVGLTTTFLFHMLVNIGMALGMAPVTGIPLPFISYGGTFLIICLFQVGLLLNVSIRRNDY